MTKIIFTFAGHPDLLMQSMYKMLGNPSDEKDKYDRSQKSKEQTINKHSTSEEVEKVLATAVAINKK